MCIKSFVDLEKCLYHNLILSFFVVFFFKSVLGGCQVIYIGSKRHSQISSRSLENLDS